MKRWKTRAVCEICGTPLTTPNDRRIGDKYYCADDYQREKEESENIREKRRNKKAKRILRGFGDEI